METISNFLLYLAGVLPDWLPWVLLLLMLVGMIASVVVTTYRSQKRVHVRFEEMHRDFNPDRLSKDDLYKFYTELDISVRPSLFGRRRRIADEMLLRVRAIASRYIHEEIVDSLKDRNFVLSDTLSTLSETHKKLFKRDLNA